MVTTRFLQKKRGKIKLNIKGKTKFVVRCYRLYDMKKIVILIAAFSILLSCNNKAAKNSKGQKIPTVTVSILPEKTFVKKIAGNDFKVNVLIPPGASPAAYTLLPSQLKDIAHSELWFRIGYIGFEHSWKSKIMQANSHMKVVNLSEGLDLIEEKGSGLHHGVNPHIWMSPKLVKQIAKVILDELIALNPQKTDVYTANYNVFLEECNRVDCQLKEMLKDYQGRKFILYHPSLAYYARDYGLVEYSIELDGKEPTTKHFKELIDMAKSENIKAVYIQSYFDKEHARVFANEIGGKIVQIWPLNPAWRDNLLETTKTLIENF